MAEPIEILLKDGDVVAVAKPAGVPVIPARGEPPEASLRRRLEQQLGRPLWVVHRIDREASGLVLFTATAEAHRALSLAFERRQVEKSYVAFVAGTLRPPAGRIDVALHEARRGKARPARPGEPGRREAATDYAVERVWRRGAATVARVEARPLTGRHHQIRVHLRSRETPILFDPLYGRSATLADSPCHRLALHARRLVTPGPAGDGRLVLEAPLAEDLVRLEQWLDAEWKADSR